MHLGTRLTNRFVMFAILFPLAAGSTIVGFRHAWESSLDLQWAPARILLFRASPAHLYLEDKSGVSTQYSSILQSVPNYDLDQVPNYPPSGLVFLWPLALLPWPIAKLTWAVLNLGFAFGIVVILERLYLVNLHKSSIALVTTLFFIGTPFRNTIGNGQYGIFVLFCFLSALYAQRRKHACPVDTQEHQIW
jgi:Glycosyltransferase family 87